MTANEAAMPPLTPAGAVRVLDEVIGYLGHDILGPHNHVPELRQVRAALARLTPAMPKVEALRKSEPWPQFGITGDARLDARTAYNAAVDDCLAALAATPSPAPAMPDSEALRAAGIAVAWATLENDVLYPGDWAPQRADLFRVGRRAVEAAYALAATPSPAPAAEALRAALAEYGSHTVSCRWDGPVQHRCTCGWDTFLADYDAALRVGAPEPT
jgi:hypothetical protein